MQCQFLYANNCGNNISENWRNISNTDILFYLVFPILRNLQLWIIWWLALFMKGYCDQLGGWWIHWSVISIIEGSRDIITYPIMTKESLGKKYSSSSINHFWLKCELKKLNHTNVSSRLNASLAHRTIRKLLEMKIWFHFNSTAVPIPA